MLSNKAIKKAIKHNMIKIEPFDEKHIGPNSYDLHLGDTLAVYDLTKQEWESLCCCCGLCCLYKVRLSLEEKSPLFLTRVACNYLNLNTKKCECYETRYHEDNGCGDLCMQTLKDKNLVPRCCAYAEKVFGKVEYSPKIDWSKVIHEKDIPYGKTLKDFIISKQDYFK